MALQRHCVLVWTAAKMASEPLLVVRLEVEVVVIPTRKGALAYSTFEGMLFGFNMALLMSFEVCYFAIHLKRAEHEHEVVVGKGLKTYLVANRALKPSC
jgi:hypothetical protein